MKKFKKYFSPMLFTLVASVNVVSCTKDKGEVPKPLSFKVCDTMIVSYQNHIKPIIDVSCSVTGCHTAKAPVWKGDFTTYVGLKLKIDNGRFRKRMIGENSSVMPPSGMLSSDKIEIIDCWIKQGARDN